MKRTTYILIGTLVVSFLGVMGFFFYIARFGTERHPLSVSLDAEMKEVELRGSIRAIRVISNDKIINDLQILASGCLTITPSDTVGVQRLVYPDCEQVKVEQVGDTLLVNLQLQSLAPSLEAHRVGIMFVDGISLKLMADSNLSCVQMNAGSMNLLIKGLSADSLAIRTGQEIGANGGNSTVKIDSCCFRSVDIVGKYLDFRGEKSRIDNFYLDLDGVYMWRFSECEVHTEYLTGSEQSRCEVAKGECKQLVWLPKNEKAELNVQLYEKTMMLIGD